MQATYTTWFQRYYRGEVLKEEYMHAIQYIPFTPISEVLLSPKWMSESYGVCEYTIRRPDPPIQEGFYNFLVMGRAAFDADGAWAMARNIKTFKGPWTYQSRATMLHWIATRPEPGTLGFSIPQYPRDDVSPKDKEIKELTDMYDEMRKTKHADKIVTTWIPLIVVALTSIMPVMWIVLLFTPK